MEGAPSETQVQKCNFSEQKQCSDIEEIGLETKAENSVRLLVQEEGRAARNLIAFSVPRDMVQIDSSKVSRKPPSSPRTVQDLKKDDAPIRTTKRAPDSSNPGSRVRSASTGRDKKSELQARYWAFLFGNLQRAVDEIYQTCETDESVSECKEVILVLENFTKDFHNLIEWFRLKWEYEKTPPPQRPNSLAWEVRKSSPGKIQQHILPSFSSPVKRILNFGDPNENDRSKAVGDKVSDNLKTGKSSPIIPVVEGEEMATFEAPSALSNGPHNSNDSNQRAQSDKEKEALVMACKDVKESTLEARIKSEKDNDLPMQEIPEERKRTCPDGDPLPKTVNTVGCGHPQLILEETLPDTFSEVTTEILPAGMTSQACQTDPELEESVSDPCNFPTMVDKGVGTSASKVLTSRSHQAVAGRASVTATPTTQHRNIVAASSPSTFAGAATRAPSVSSRIPPSSTLKNTCASSKGVPLTVNSNSKATPPAVGPTGNSLVSSCSIVKGAPVLGTPGVKVSLPSSSVLSTSAKASLASIVNKPSTASVVKRNFNRPSSLVSSQSINSPSASRSSILPKLQRSRTVVEVSRPHKPNHSYRGGAPRQLKEIPYSEAGSGSQKGTRSKASIQNTSVAEGSKQNESGDDAGWETVKNRSRWRLSGNYNAKNRFNKPTCAVSLPALIIVDDDDDESVVMKNSLSKQISQDTTSSRRHSDKTDHPPPDVTKLKRSPKPKSNDSSGAPKSKLEKSANNESRQLLGKKIGKDVKGGNLDAVIHPKSEGSGSLKPKNGIQVPLKQKGMSSKGKENQDSSEQENLDEIQWKLCNGNKKNDLHIDNQLSGDESSVGPRTSPTTTPATMTPTTTPATPTTPTNSASESMAFLRDTDGGIDRVISDEEAERTLLKEEERKSQQLYEEEVKLQQQIDELQSAELEVEVETDGENQVGTEEEEEEELLGGDEPRDVDAEIDTMSLEARYENMLEGLSWAERMDTLEKLEALVARHPGRALQLHQKLSSPSRSRAITLPETLRRFQARQEKAQQKRERLLQLKSQKLRDLLNKVGEVKAAQEQLTEDRRLRLENKLKRAEENRNLHLKSIKRKAHDEEEKLKEIAFINELEAQNKRHDFLALRQEQEERLQGIAEERQRKQEEKAAKEAAVEERKRVLEAERLQKLEEMQARRKRRVERIHREQLEKEKERQEAAREKARDREERLSALHAAQLATQEELQKKIQQKQEDSARRHEENIEHIRQRALESAALRYADDAAPALEPYRSKKLCTLCNVLIGSEVYLLSHLRGKSHQEALKKSSGGRGNSTNVSPREDLDHIAEAPPDCIDEKQERHKERQRALKKRAKKLRLRMTAKGLEYEKSLVDTRKASSPNSARIQKCLREVEKLHNSQGLGQWSNNAVTLLERALAEINRILDKKSEADQTAFCMVNGFSTICNILSLGLNVPQGMSPYLPSKCFVTACTTLSLACLEHPANAEHMLMSNKISNILDLLMCRLKDVVPDEDDSLQPWSGPLPIDAVAVALMRLLALLLAFAKDGSNAVRARDVVR
ncbi:S phase cyclin A-associated protein in the endoplasmic reticulum [Frankliniella fusca]|uniref:S phase cyclin A-associated protein in the endoplasmic reticulum n=1 Tax=Frankliniella fusca TaxID=407009 RepID=A0AAE1HPC2_9NEOP|nr:S phase cyclin A-associated protein in the endoplasmic reticulum [Frankliniella fusca]